MEKLLNILLLNKLKNKKGGGGTTEPYEWNYLGYNTKVDDTLDPFQYSWNVLQNWNKATTNADAFFRENNNLVYLPKLDMTNVTSARGFLRQCTNLKSIPAITTPNVTDMYCFCFLDTTLENVELFDTSKVLNFQYMFGGCSKLAEIPLFDTSSASTINSMVSGTKIETVPSFNTPNVEDMGYMCDGCSELVNFPVLDVTKVTSMVYMFRDCSKLSDTSLNNILDMCAHTTSALTMQKKLSNLYLSGAQINRCQLLSNWSQAQANGWTV